MQLLVFDFKYLNYKFSKPWETLFPIFSMENTLELWISETRRTTAVTQTNWTQIFEFQQW